MKQAQHVKFAGMFAGALMAVTVFAETMPEPENGTVTLNVSSGTVTYTSGIPSGTTQIVKTGDGEAVLSEATAGYEGSVEVQGGTLSLSDYNALGTGGKAAVAVADGATFALKGRHALLDSECLYAGTITITGTGCGSVGALYYAPTSGTAKMADAAFKSVRLAGDAAVGNTRRCGWRSGELDLNGKTLTLLNGAAANGGLYMFFDTVFHPGRIVFQGNVSANASQTWFWNNNDFTTYGCTEDNLVFTVEPKAAVNMYNSKSEIPAFWNLYGGLTGAKGTGAGMNRLTGTVKLMTSTTLSSQDGTLNINGKVDLNGYELKRYQTMPTYFAGPVDGRTAGSCIFPQRGDFVFTGNVERVISGTTKIVSQGVQYGAAMVEVDGGTYLSSALQCGYGSGYRGIFSLKSGWAGFGSVVLGFNGTDTTRPNGVFRMSGGTFDYGETFTMCGSDSTNQRRSQAFYLQSGGRCALTNEIASVETTVMQVGAWGDAIMHIGGGTNSMITASSRTARRACFKCCAGKGTTCVAIEGAASRLEADQARFLQSSTDAYCTLSLKDGGEFCARRFTRNTSLDADQADAVFNLIADGGVFKPLLAGGLNDMAYSDNPNGCEKARPNNTVLLAKGLVFDLSECASFTAGQLGDSEIAWRFKKPTGKSLKSVTLPAAVASLDYFEPAMIVIAGNGFGASAYCDVDRSTKRLTSPVIICAGSGYDESTTTVSVYGPDSVAKYACTFELEAVTCGPLTVRGSDHELFLPMPDNTFDGGIIVEQGSLKLGTNGFVEATAVALGDAKGHRGALNFDDAAAHTISTLSGRGQLVTRKNGSVTIATSYSVDAALLDAQGGITTTCALTFASGSKIVVSNVASCPLEKIDLVSAGTLTGEPTIELTGTDAAKWVVRRSEQKFILKRRHGLFLVIY